MVDTQRREIARELLTEAAIGALAADTQAQALIVEARVVARVVA